jgi:hypothetical protein
LPNDENGFAAGAAGWVAPKLNDPGACVVGAVLPKLSPGVLEGACEVWKGLFTGAACGVDWPKVKPPVAGFACVFWPKENGLLAGCD